MVIENCDFFEHYKQRSQVEEFHAIEAIGNFLSALRSNAVNGSSPLGRSIDSSAWSQSLQTE